MRPETGPGAGPVAPRGPLPPAVRWRDRGLTLGAWLALAAAAAGAGGGEGLAGPAGWSAFATDLGRTAGAAAGVVAFLLAWGALDRWHRARRRGEAPDPVALAGIRAAAAALAIEPARLRAWRRAPALHLVASPEGHLTPAAPAPARPPARTAAG